MKERILNALRYMLLMFAAELPASGVFFVALQIVAAIAGKSAIYDYREAIPLLIISTLFGIACAALIRFFYFRSNFSNFLVFGEHRIVDIQSTVKNYAFMVFPGELIRFLLSALKFRPSKMLGLHFLEGIFSEAADYYWYCAYLVPNGKVESSRVNGFSLEDNLHFSYIYLVILVFEMALFALLLYLLYRKYRSEHKNTLTMETSYKDQENEIVQRTFFFENTITVAEILRCAAFLIGTQVFTAFILSLTNYIMDYWSALAGGDPLYIFRILFTLPLPVIVPILILKRFLKFVVKKNVSLADENANRLGKAIRLFAPGEAVRFVLGLLPFGAFAIGSLTSPLAYQLYTLGYRFPFERLEISTMSAVDVLVYIAVYIVCFAVFELLLFRGYKKCCDSQISKLKGDLYERNKR